MGLEIHKGFFKGKNQALEDILATGFWPTTLVSQPSPALDPHWHDSDIHGYVVEGSTWLLDGESGKRLDIEAGDKLIIPYGTIHAEGETTDPVVYIIAIPDPRSLFEVLQMRAPGSTR